MNLPLEKRPYSIMNIMSIKAFQEQLFKIFMLLIMVKELRILPIQ